MNTIKDDIIDKKLDELLASLPVAPSADFADRVLSAVKHNADTFDSLLDAQLQADTVPPDDTRSERIFQNVIQDARRRREIRFARVALAAAAVVAMFIAIPAFFQTNNTSGDAQTARQPASADASAVAPRTTTNDSDELLASAIAEDPDLAAILDNPAIAISGETAVLPIPLDLDTADTVASLNDNTLVWLESLTLYAQ